MAQQLNFTERQANAILDMRLYKLIGLEIEALMKGERGDQCQYLQIRRYSRDAEFYGTGHYTRTGCLKETICRKRKTHVESAEEAVYGEKPEDIELMFLMDKFGYCKTIDIAAFGRNKEAALAEFKYVVKVQKYWQNLSVYQHRTTSTRSK